MNHKRTKKVCLIVLLCFTLALSCMTTAFAADGYFKASDARHALRIAAMLEPMNWIYDFNSDGKVTADEARAILKHAAHLIGSDLDSELVAVPTTTRTAAPTYNGTQSGVLSSCGLTESQLANGLKKSLKQYAATFLEAERQYGVNAVFLSAVAALESGWGESAIAKNRNNLFGWNGDDSFKIFSSVSEGIMYVARMIKQNYLTPGGSCFYGYNVEDIERSYCPSGGWASAVRDLMSTISNGAY